MLRRTREPTIDSRAIRLRLPHVKRSRRPNTGAGSARLVETAAVSNPPPASSLPQDIIDSRSALSRSRHCPRPAALLRSLILPAPSFARSAAIQPALHPGSPLPSSQRDHTTIRRASATILHPIRCGSLDPRPSDHSATGRRVSVRIAWYLPYRAAASRCRDRAPSA